MARTLPVPTLSLSFSRHPFDLNRFRDVWWLENPPPPHDLFRIKIYNTNHCVLQQGCSDDSLPRLLIQPTFKSCVHSVLDEIWMSSWISRLERRHRGWIWGQRFHKGIQVTYRNKLYRTCFYLFGYEQWRNEAFSESSCFIYTASIVIRCLSIVKKIMSFNITDWFGVVWHLISHWTFPQVMASALFTQTRSDEVISSIIHKLHNSSKLHCSSSNQ